MKTIEEAVTDFVNSSIDKCPYSFRAGIEFAQQWIEAKKEIPKQDLSKHCPEWSHPVLAKSNEAYHGICVASYCYTTKQWYFDNEKIEVICWRPIELT